MMKVIQYTDSAHRAENMHEHVSRKLLISLNKINRRIS